jgi:anti-sigma factor RsiW
MKTNCTGMDTKLADLLLDPDRAPAKVKAHVDACEHCRAELAELQATMALLDTWKGPEPSPYFLSRLDARMREQREAEPASWPARWFARLRASFLYGPHTHVRPLAAMALTVMLLIGGGAYLGITDWDQTANPPGQAAVVHDLQTLDNNAQLLDQLEALSSNNDNGD